MHISERPLRITLLVVVGLIGGVAGSLGMTLFLLPSMTSVSVPQNIGSTLPVKAFVNTPRLPTVSVSVVSKHSLKDVPGGTAIADDVEFAAATILTADGWLVADTASFSSIQDPIVLLPRGIAKAPTSVIADAQTGLTYFRVDATDLPVVAFGDSASLSSGAFVFITAPNNLVSPSGLVSAHARAHADAAASVRLSDMPTDRLLLQSAVEKRIAGAGVVNNAGALVGVLDFKTQTNGMREAVPIEVIQKSLRELVRTGVLHHLTLQMSTVDVSELATRSANLSSSFGAVVASVDAGGSAANAGIAVGDRITVFGGDALDGSKLLSDYLLNYRVGDQVTVTYFRGSEEKTTSVVVSEVKAVEKKVGK